MSQGRLNVVWLNAFVSGLKIKYDPDTMEPVAATFFANTVKRTYTDKNNHEHHSRRIISVPVFTRNPKLIYAAMTEEYRQNGVLTPRLANGDFVQVKGTLVTQDVKRKFVCKECHHISYKPLSVQIYVDPLSVNVINREYRGLKKDDPQFLMLLEKEYAETSNSVYIMGRLCREPRINENDSTQSDYYVSKKGKRELPKFQFQIATERNRHIKEDPADKRTDFPWVKCYGDNALDCKEALHKGSTIVIDGVIQTKEATVHYICDNPECRASLTNNVIVTDIVPYYVEFCRDCDIPKYDLIDISGFEEDMYHGQEE